MAVQHNKGFIGKINERYGFPFGQRMVRIGHKTAFTVVEFLINEFLTEACRVIRQGNIEFFIFDHLQSGDPAGFDDLEFNLRMRDAELS